MMFISAWIESKYIMTAISTYFELFKCGKIKLMLPYSPQNTTPDVFYFCFVLSHVNYYVSTVISFQVILKKKTNIISFL